eukprot:TRINITY_DN101752_c0_g1_i1.p1 TRINITY_DN101752_c0_g1~~TRINITY_DN101752_c0_g1_i1.p1  ORF type:complete len:1281 (-),score=479.86 TRINITY_DN101752_c0_g1_i1:216-4058(-)
MAAEGGSTVRRDALQAIEEEVQKKWDQLKIFETDAPDADSEKFMCTFPYPYMNGLLHIGHAFSLTKAVFAAHYNRLLGKKVLLPFGYHCTGMPIQAAANKLKREFETFGAPYPTFPAGRPAAKEVKEEIFIDEAGNVRLLFKPPACTGKKDIKMFHILWSKGGSDFSEVAKQAPPSPEELAKTSGKVEVSVPIAAENCVYKVKTELKDGSFCPDSKESDGISAGETTTTKKAGGAAGGGKRVAKKIVAKTGDAATQWEILKSMKTPIDDIPKFVDPLHWLDYYPPLGQRDLKRFGCPIDHRRSFITTSINPYYDSFIRWQFRKLKAAEKIGFGKRPTIFSELDGQACMDHDRAEGEGVGPQEYTAIKIELLEFPDKMKSLKGKKVYLLAATLRPETMPGQTNCWILPSGEYGCYKAGGNDIYVTSHRAARNMSFQDILTPWGKPECVLTVTGQDLMGCAVKAPTAKYDKMHLLPLPTIKMDKGTGIVTSVPSDSPDDYAAFMDLMKPGKRDHFKLKKEWVEPFELVPIIDVEIDGEIRDLAAKYMCEKLGVASINDRVKLAEAHDTCYKLGFDKGVMSNGPFKGKPVKDAKNLFKDKMIKDKQAFTYSEPEKKVVSRTGDDCVVALIDQWYLKYGQKEWQKQILDHLNGPNFCAYNDRIKDSFNTAIGWLKEWACSRSFGLGTKVPWDEQFVVESLSDSTIYMGYYTVAHILQNGVLDGSEGNPDKIKPEDLTDDVWDYVFLKDAKAPKISKIKKPVLEKMRKEFRFWYPMDLRVSGKDLIQNHLTMSLYNHACIWEKEPEMWPQGIFANGWLMVDSEKMSKSKGNFYTLEDIIKKFSADSFRVACANAGDTLEDCNMELDVAKKALLDMPVMLDLLKAIMKGEEPMEERKVDAKFVDRWFQNEMNKKAEEAKKHYDTMYYREALRVVWFEFTRLFSQYRDICKSCQWQPNKTLTMRYFEWQMIMLSPIAPHICEHCWGLLGKKGSVLDARFPVPTAPADAAVSMQGVYMFDKVKNASIKALEKAMEKAGKPPSCTVYFAKSHPEWKLKVLDILRKAHASGKMALLNQDQLKENPEAAGNWKVIMTDLMKDQSLKPFGKFVGPFAAFKRDEAAAEGIGALDAAVPFDEKALLSEYAGYLKDKLKMDVSVASADALAAPAHKDAAANAQPGQPSYYYEPGAPLEKGAGGAKAKAKADGGKPAAAAKNGKAAASVATIKDLAKLNEHLSSRSYFEGGAKPTAGDIAQLGDLPSSIVDATKYPHVARWQRHIESFKPAQRAKW